MESARIEHPANPREGANFLSKLFFTWTIPFFRKGYKKILQIDDVYKPLSCDRSQQLGDRLEANWVKQKLKSNRPSLLRAIVATFWKDYLFLGTVCIINDVLRLGQPFLLGHLLKYFREQSTVTYEEALMYASGIVILNGLYSVLSNQMFQLAMHCGMNVRISISTLVYRKALHLSQTALGETAPGKVVNLLSNDVSRFDYASMFLNAIWESPIITIMITSLVWLEIGVVGIIGVLTVLSVVPFMSYTGKVLSKYRFETALKTDERVRFMDEIISGVQILKMYAWEKPFAKLIAYVRKVELKVIRKANYIRGLTLTMMLFTNRIAVSAIMLGIVLLYGPDQLTAARIFAVATYFNILGNMMSLRVPRAIGEGAEVLVSIRRIQQFLELEEKKTESGSGSHENGKHFPEDNSVLSVIKDSNSTEVTDVKNPNACISMQNVSARWTMPKDNIFNLKKGKSRKNKGIIQNGVSIKDNQGTPVLNDLSIDFPKGKLIGVIGPVGAGKSSLLQALLRELPLESGSISINGSISYASQESWIFAASIRQNILFGQEYDRDRYNAVVRTCALTRDFEQFERGDLTLVGERGISLSGGQKARINLARACYRNADIYLFDDPLSAVDAHVGTHIFNKCIGPKSHLAKRKTTRILVTHQVHFLKEADWLIVLKDGKVEVQGCPSDLYESGVDFIEHVGLVEKSDDIENKETRTRRKSAISRRSASSASSNSDTEIDDKAIEKDLGVQIEDSSKGKFKGSLALSYFRAGGNWLTLSTLLFSFILVQFLASAADYWVSIWTRQEEVRSQSFQETTSFYMSTDFCMFVQVFLIAALIIFGISRAFGYYCVCMRSSQVMHNAMFQGIISTPMRFFDTNPSGRILNRFSKDLGSVDENLSKSMFDTVQNILSIFGTIVVAAVVNPYFLIPTLILSTFFVFIRKIYLRTSKNLRRLEGMAKSPTYTHLTATLNGLSTVRAFNTQDILIKEFENFQDTHTSCWYMYISTSSMFGFTLDFICTIFMTCIIFYYMLFENDATGEKIGLAVSQAIGLSTIVPWGARQSAEIVNHMTAVERVLEYRDLKPEKQPEKPLVMASDWPSKGCIEFRKVFYRYFAEAEPVLRNLSFVINPMEKIGIVGRTGAGKSSLIGSLFHLGHIEGEILIDAIDTANIQLSDLRKQIAIIPQDPVLFSGTLRRNLDPFEEYSDAEIWSALESVELKRAVSDALGLQSRVLPQGLNYSVGQRQLLCLARAILRKNRILVLDEATANVDPQTDLLIQQTIREKFTECTVLTVAHRLHTIIDSDRVMVMDAGEAVEFDTAYNLLQNEKGIFYGMVKALGDQEFDRLAKVAIKKHEGIIEYSSDNEVTRL